MRKLLSLLLAMMMFCTILSIVSYAEESSVIFVSPTGSDKDPGTIEQPLKTVQAAVSIAKDQKASKIYLRAGNYIDPVALDKNCNNLTIEPYNGEKVTFDGGTSIPFSSFKKVTDKAVLDRIVENAGKEKVVSVKLSNFDVTDYGQISPQGFFTCDGQGYSPSLTYKDDFLDYACYPNGDDYLFTKDVLDKGNPEKIVLGKLLEAKFTLNSDRYTKWKNASDIWALAFFCYDWADETVPAMFDYDTGVVTSCTNDNYFVQQNRRVKFFNLLEELDVPGEWYLDRDSGMLYLIPPEGISDSESVVFSSYKKDFITINGSSNITIKGIRFANNLARGIVMADADSCVVSDCEFADFGDNCVDISTSKKCGVKNSWMHDLGSRGVQISNCGDRATLTPGECFVDNSLFETFTQYKKTYAPAITISGVGNKISHNEIHDAPHFAISFGSNDNIIEYNNIYDVCQSTADCGAIYIGRDWSCRGNVIRYNYFHDMKKMETTAGGNVQAVYLDDMHSSTAVYGNVFCRVSSVALYGGGRNNTFENNLMVDCTAPFAFDARGTNGGKWEDMVQTMIKRLDNVPYKDSLWASRYPELVNILDDEPRIPKYNVIRNNAEYRSAGYEINDLVKKYGTVENNVELKSTKSFADYRGRDFTLVDGSEIFQLIPDFKPIPFKEMGRYTTADTDTIKVVVNGSNLESDVPPTIINDRTMVPLRAIFYALGAEVSWDDATKTVTASKGGTVIVMQIGNSEMTKNGEKILLDAPPAIVESRTLVPARAIAESFGCSVDWNGDTKTVTISE